MPDFPLQHLESSDATVAVVIPTQRGAIDRLGRRRVAGVHRKPSHRVGRRQQGSNGRARTLGRSRDRCRWIWSWPSLLESILGRRRCCQACPSVTAPGVGDMRTRSFGPRHGGIASSSCFLHANLHLVATAVVKSAGEMRTPKRSHQMITL
jgi:hypothetical protein